MSNFDKCIGIILKNEGGYINHPNDPGGETKYGISKRSFPDIDIKNLTEKQASEIYYNYYWLRLKCDQINDINAALQLFDFGVNAGKSKAVRTAQQVCAVKRDGKIGPVTIKAINKHPDFVNSYRNERLYFYESLTRKRPSMEVFLDGWYNRVKHTKL